MIANESKPSPRHYGRVRAACGHKGARLTTNRLLIGCHRCQRWLDDRDLLASVRRDFDGAGL